MQMSKTQWGYITQSVHTCAHLMYINTQLIFKGELAAYVTEQIYRFTVSVQCFCFFLCCFMNPFLKKANNCEKIENVVKLNTV